MSFFSKVKNFFHKLFGSLPAWSKATSATLTMIAPLTEEIVALAAGEPAAEEVKSIVSQVQTDMATIGAVVGDATEAPSASGYATAETALNSIKTNLGSLLSAGHIKNPDTLQKVTGVVDTIIGEAEAILQELPKPAATAQSSAPATA